MLRSQERYRSNLLIFSLVIFLTLFGLNVLLAASNFLARQEYGDPYFFIKRQALYAFLGFLSLLFCSQLPYTFWEKWAWPFYGLSLVLLLLVFVPPLGKKAGGAHRWLNFGFFSIQPSDIARFCLILLIARLYARWERPGLAHVALTVTLVFFPVLLIALEPDLSTALHLLLCAGLLLFLTSFPWYMHLLFLLLSLPVVYYFIFYTPFRLERLKAFLDPWTYRYEGAYQLVASFKSFAAGGFWGKGLGEGLRRHNLQARHTDFILSIVAEDMGFLGIVLLLIIYFGLATYGLYLMSKIEKPFARLLGSGVLIIFFTQFSMHVAVTMGLLPTTGISLPLLSYGGTSLVMYMSMFGILLNITRLEH
ncbi:MAG: FtsW/RodA/SpoVE family cell cycle protein [Leptospiraceae bacterium]|nr:FtsW/RodA/SpoVE family cell cycle protein [Leptospiraceae bacterium]MDW8306135.1 FtsW/RodA/SpoVE family cell cycle protein [Leptospiraceae bacterium]